MDRFIDFINSALPDAPGDDILFKFKRQTLDDMNLRFAEVSSRGVDNPAVMADLVMSEHPDLQKEYDAFKKDYLKRIKDKKSAVRNAVGSVVYLIALVGLYLLVSFVTHAWSMTWAIIVDGVLLWVVYLLSTAVKYFTAMKRIFHIFARIALAGAIIVAMVAVYIFVVAVSDIPRSWLIVIFGLIAMFVGDGAYAVIAKHRLAMISWLIYVPVIATFLFIIIGALSIVPWGIAWIIIPLSLVIDVVIIAAAAAKRKLEKTEVQDAWNES